MTRTRNSIVGLGLALAASSAWAVEVEVKNDSLTDGSGATICPCFIPGEEAAVWLTSPCDGDIVALQIFWRSQLGGAAQVIEESITVYEGGVYPFPGPIKNELLAPVLTDGVLNEFRYFDENQTVPIQIPVTAGEEFVVSLAFFNPSSVLEPSIVFDGDGINTGKNAVFTSTGGWTSSEGLGVSGDWVIRAIIECPVTTDGACCLSESICVEVADQTECENQGGVYLGDGTNCGTSPCADLEAACCFPGGGCLTLASDDCDTAFGVWQGIGSVCPTACVPDCEGDVDFDGDTDVFDFADMAANFGVGPGATRAMGDLDANGFVNVFDFATLAADFGCTAP